MRFNSFVRGHDVFWDSHNALQDSARGPCTDTRPQMEAIMRDFSLKIERLKNWNSLLTREEKEKEG